MNKFVKLFAFSLLAVPFLSACDPIKTGDTPHEHTPSANWEYDNNRHWHSCTGCGMHLDEANHTFDAGTETETGIKYTCTVCGYYYEEYEPFVDELEAMNLEIQGKSFIDRFEVREHLLSKGYHFDHIFDDGTRYGYSKAHQKVVEYKNNQVTKPTECIGDEYFEYNKISIASFASLASTINDLNLNNSDYDIIELSGDIYQVASSPLVRYTNSRDLEINLKGYHIYANEEVDKDYQSEKWFTLQFVDKSDEASIYVHNGYIEANRKMKSTGVEDDSCCLSLVAAKSFRLNGLNLLAKNGSQCIGDMSQEVSLWHDKNKEVHIANVNMDASLRALTIAGGTWDIKNCTSIRGMVCIDGGTVNIDSVVVDASNAKVNGLNEYAHGYSNSELASTIVTNVNGAEVYTTVENAVKQYRGAMNFNDAINVLSRRMNIYDVAKVTVTNSSLTPVIVNNVVTGYGFRYWDLGDTTSGEAVIPTLTNNLYPRFDSETGFGGSNIG